MGPPSPRSTLFPYTTLFRSCLIVGAPGRADMIAKKYLQHTKRFSNDKRGLVSQDRKSTRLNSSHTVSSYAVFCLKKKIAPGLAGVRCDVALDAKRLVDAPGA